MIGLQIWDGGESDASGAKTPTMENSHLNNMI